MTAPLASTCKHMPKTEQSKSERVKYIVDGFDSFDPFELPMSDSNPDEVDWFGA